MEAVCREAAQIAVRQYVLEAESDASVEEIEVTAEHFETALDKVDTTAPLSRIHWSASPPTVRRRIPSGPRCASPISPTGTRADRAR
ncbi:hypothetical protein ACFQL3_16055 [Natronoarchaeum sp. GCM10025321]|uniref:hypothetical protein n=1 Tax=Natronoarchaeum sp. GCM10025321 TaxID=3252684 RepID=UPI003620E2DE